MSDDTYDPAKALRDVAACPECREELAKFCEPPNLWKKGEWCDYCGREHCEAPRPETHG